MNQLLNTFFFSGSSNITDLRAVLAGGGNPGVVSGLLSKNSMSVLRASQKVPLFVDSGAFGGVVEGFGSVFEKYRALGEFHPHNLLYVVMPDVYKDQHASMRLIDQYCEEIQSFIDDGFECIVPFQRGTLSLVELHRYVVSVLGHSNFRVGLPMSAEARHPPEDILSFLNHTPDLRIHFLGRSFRPLEKELRLYKTFHDFDASADAAMLVNWLSGERECALNVECAWESAIKSWDDTEIAYIIYNEPESLTDDAFKFIASYFNLKPKQVAEVAALDHWKEFVDYYTCHELMHLVHFVLCKASPKRDAREQQLAKKVKCYLNGEIMPRLNQTEQVQLALV